MKELVSIITPAHNSEKYIKYSIESVINQTYENWEMVIVDDASTDNTFKIVSQIVEKDKRIKLIHLKTNVGVAKARNIALEHANGNIIAFLDSDDIWSKVKLQKQLEFMINNNYCLTYTGYGKFNSDGNECSSVVIPPTLMRENDILKNTCIGCLTVMVNKKIVGDFKMPLLNHSEDQCTWMEILSRGFVAHGLPEVLAFYRVYSNSLSGNKLKAIKKQWIVYREYHQLNFFKSLFYFCCYLKNAIFR